MRTAAFAVVAIWVHGIFVGMLAEQLTSSGRPSVWPVAVVGVSSVVAMLAVFALVRSIIEREASR